MIRGTIDEIALLATGEAPALLAAGDALDVRGWLLPPDPRAEIVIDGRTRHPVTVGDPRPDVQAALGGDAATHCGYRAVVPTYGLGDGRHEIALWARDGAGGDSVVASRTIDVRVRRPDGAGPAVAGFADRYLDEEGVEHLINGASANVRGAEVVTIRGWAIDDAQRLPARGAVALIGPYAVPALYGFERPDVAAVFESDELRFCGFSATFPGSYVEPGGTPFKLVLCGGGERGFLATSIEVLLHAR